MISVKDRETIWQCQQKNPKNLHYYKLLEAVFPDSEMIKK